MSKGGRPTDYTPEIADKICAKLAEGNSLRKICKEKGMPGLSTVMRWRREKEEFREQYASAREDQADHFADEIIEISDDLSEEANSRRIRIDARKWTASKLKPKAYGDKIDLNHSGSIQNQTDEEIKSRLTELLGKAGTAGLNVGDGETGEPEED